PASGAVTKGLSVARPAEKCTSGTPVCWTSHRTWSGASPPPAAITGMLPARRVRWRRRSTASMARGSPPEVRMRCTPSSLQRSSAATWSGTSSNARWKVISRPFARSNTARMKAPSGIPAASSAPVTTPRTPGSAQNRATSARTTARASGPKWHGPGTGRTNTRTGRPVCACTTRTSPSAGVMPPQPSQEQTSRESTPAVAAMQASSTVVTQASTATVMCQTYTPPPHRAGPCTPQLRHACHVQRHRMNARQILHPLLIGLALTVAAPAPAATDNVPAASLSANSGVSPIQKARQAVADAARRGDLAAQFAALMELTKVELEMGTAHHALQTAFKARDLATAMGDGAAMTTCLRSIATACQCVLRYNKSVEMARNILALAVAGQDTRAVLSARIFLVRQRTTSGQAEEALQMGRAMLVQAELRRDHLCAAQVHLAMGHA